MKKPPAVRPGDEVTVIGHVFETPLVVRGRTWLPVAQFGAWGIMAWLAGKRRPQRTWGQRLWVGLMTMAVALGSEWLHNLAHAVAAHLIGKPMDALRITWGMPLVVYYDLNDQDVTPREHIVRALGGPLFNAALLIPLVGLRCAARDGTAAREVLDMAVGANVFLSTVSMLPMPGIDGGAALKWALVADGRSVPQADEAVRRVNRWMGVALSVAGAVAFWKRKRIIGGVLALCGAMASAIGHGLIEE